MRAAVLAPGYGGGADQQILHALTRALADVGIQARAIAFSTRGRRPSAKYATELAELRAARDALRAEGATRVALERVTCPTLVVQGSRDELGPLAVLERIAGANPQLDLVVIDGAGHDFGPREGEAVAAVARWLDVLRADATEV